MPPHCDTLDGPVVKAARDALASGNVSLVLPYVPAASEAEARASFTRTMAARAQYGACREVADNAFFETVVRLHRAGEGEPYEGLKPAGGDWGPIVPLAEAALRTGNIQPVVDALTAALRHALEERCEAALQLRDYDPNDVRAARAYVNAMLEFELFAHHLHEFVEEGHGHGEPLAPVAHLEHRHTKH